MIFDFPVDRTNTDSVKWNKRERAYISSNPEAEPFWVADMDFPLEEHIKAKGLELANLGIYGYPEHHDITGSVASWLERKHSWHVESNNILYTMGLLHGIALAINLFTNEGDTILVPSPTYRPFRTLCENNNRIMLDHELGYDDGRFYLDRDRFQDDAKRSKMILFCSPHNPSGLVFTESDLKFVLKCAKDNNIPVLSDEIHADLVHTNAIHIPMGRTNENIGAKCITYMAPSKTFNVAGEHAGFAIFSDDSMKEAFANKQKGLWLTSPGILIGELTEEAYNKGLEYNLELCQYLTDNARIIKEFLKKNCSEIKFVNGEASFVTFLDCSAIYDKAKAKVEANPEQYPGGMGGGILSRFFGVNAYVAMNDGTWFGSQYYNFVRFNYGTSRERVINALERMAKAIHEL